MPTGERGLQHTHKKAKRRPNGTPKGELVYVYHQKFFDDYRWRATQVPEPHRIRRRRERNKRARQSRKANR